MFNCLGGAMLKELWILVKMLFASKPSDIDKVVVVDMHHFPFEGYKAMYWCGSIIHRIGASEVDDRTIRHETIHLLQAKEYGSWMKYYWRYLWEWLKGNPFFAPGISAYYTIPFEMEAYANEDNTDYIVTDNTWKRYRIKHRKRIYKEYRFEWKNYVKSL